MDRDKKSQVSNEEGLRGKSENEVKNEAVHSRQDDLASRPDEEVRRATGPAGGATPRGSVADSGAVGGAVGGAVSANRFGVGDLASRPDEEVRRATAPAGGATPRGSAADSGAVGGAGSANRFGVADGNAYRGASASKGAAAGSTNRGAGAQGGPSSAAAGSADHESAARGGGAAAGGTNIGAITRGGAAGGSNRGNAATRGGAAGGSGGAATRGAGAASGAAGGAANRDACASGGAAGGAAATRVAGAAGGAATRGACASDGAAGGASCSAGAAAAAGGTAGDGGAAAAAPPPPRRGEARQSHEDMVHIKNLINSRINEFLRRNKEQVGAGNSPSAALGSVHTRRPSLNQLIMLEMSSLLEDLDMQLQALHGDAEEDHHHGSLSALCLKQLYTVVSLLSIEEGGRLSPVPEILAEETLPDLLASLDRILVIMGDSLVILRGDLEEHSGNITDIKDHLAKLNIEQLELAVPLLNVSEDKQKQEEAMQSQLEALANVVADRLRKIKNFIQNYIRLFEVADAVGAAYAMWIRMYRVGLRRVAETTQRNIAMESTDPLTLDLAHHERLIFLYKCQQRLAIALEDVRINHVADIKDRLDTLVADMKLKIERGK